MATRPDALSSALADRYRLGRELGRGGMATVYLAEDVRHRRQVAVKVFRPELAATLGPERFSREIEIVAALSHPHIVPLFDSGEAGGCLYYVMRLVEGESLRARLERGGPLPVDEAVRMAQQVAGALAYAHSRGIVHRDIKPENILLEHGHAVVTDFGIARALDAARDTGLTGVGMVIGTPAYMSPEQAVGGEVDARTDVYSLGCVLREMLAGEAPTALRPVIDRATARTPDARFSAATELVRALQTLGTGGSDDTTRERLSATTHSVAVLPFANLSPDPDNEYFADGMTEEIINALAQVKDLHVTARTSSFAFKGKKTTVAEVGRQLGVSTVLEGSVRKAGNRLRITAQLVKAADGFHLWSERYDRELADVFAIQDEIARAIAGRLQATLGGGSPLVSPSTRDLEAYELYLRGRAYWSQRGAGLMRGLRCFEQALARDPDFALAHTGVADACSLMAFYGGMDPREAMPCARDAAEKALARDPSLVEARCAFAYVRMLFDRDWDSAERVFQEVLKANPKYVAARYWYSSLLHFVRGRSAEAIEQARLGVDLDPLGPLGRVQLAVMLTGARRFEDAAAMARRAIEAEPTLHLGHRQLGIARLEMGDVEGATDVFRRAVDLSERHPWTLGDLALAHAAAGRANEAEALYRETLDRAASSYVQPVAIAVAAAAAGHPDEAIAALERAVDERDALVFTIARWPPYERAGWHRHPRYGEILQRANLA